MKIVFYVVLFIQITSNSFADPQAISRGGKGSSGGDFSSHTLSLPNHPNEKFPLCGKNVSSVLPLKIFGSWIDIEYSVSNDREPEKILPFLLEITYRVLAKNEDLKFLPYVEMKNKVILNPMTIDSRIVISYDKNDNHPLLGSKYIVLNVDSAARLVYFKHEQNDAVFSIR